MVPPGPQRQFPDEPAPRRKMAPSKRGYTTVTLPDAIYEQLRPSPTNAIRRLLETASIPWDSIEVALIAQLGYIHRAAIRNAIDTLKTAQEQS